MLFQPGNLTQCRERGSINNVRQWHSRFGAVLTPATIKLRLRLRGVAHGLGQLAKSQPGSVGLEPARGVEHHVAKQIVAQHEVMLSVLAEAKIAPGEISLFTHLTRDLRR